MPLRSTRMILAQTALVLITANSAEAQDLADVQVIANKVLFAHQDVAQQRRVAEQRRVEELDQRTRQQDTLLQQQAASVQQLGGELQLIRDERQLIDLAGAFDSAILAGRWSLARQLLANDVTVELAGRLGAPALRMAADDFIASLPSTAEGGVLPRADQHVRVEGDRAMLTSAGYAWGRPGTRGRPLGRLAGQYEYGFARTPTGWRIDRLLFRLNN